VPRAGFDVGTTVDGFGEFYVSSRISVRGLVGWANPGIDNGGGCTFVPTVCGSNTWQHIRLEGSLLYNWEGEAWHPYLVGGFGAHFLRDTLTDEYSPHFSVHGGAGIEYFARHNLSVKGEVVFHALRHHGFDAQAANGYASPNPSGLTVTIGLKRYF
jgi:hypothetical protein